MNFLKRFASQRPTPTLDFGTLPTGERLTVPFEAFDYHGLVIGPTGTGKTRFLQRFNLEVAEKHPEACVVVISPKGAFASNLRRECYRRGWRRRVVYIDFSETRRVPGINILRPWGDPFLQAKLQREILTRSMGINELTETPRLARYVFAGLYAAISTGLTIREVAMLFDHAPGGLRQAVIDRMPDCDARRDLELLEQTAQKLGQAGAARFFEEQVGSSVNRFRMLSQNPLLRLMLGSKRSLQWDELLAPGRIVIFNADQGRVLDREDQRYLVTSIIADIARTCFSRHPEQAIRVSLTVDEIGWFQSTVLSDILDRGREFKLSLVGAVQYLSQFVEPRTGDRRLLDSFLTDTLIKVVFGGLSPTDATQLAELMYRHHLDPDARQLSLYSLRQVQRIVLARSRSRSRGDTTSRSLTDTHVWGESTAETDSEAHAEAVSSGLSSSSASGEGLGTGTFAVSSTTHAALAGGMLGHGESSEATGSSHGSSDITSAFNAEGESESFSTTDVDTVGRATSRSEQEAWGEAISTANSQSIGYGVSEGPMVQPSDPFHKLSSVTFEPLESQLQRFYSRLVRQPRQHVTFASGKDLPFAFRVADVPDPTFSESQARVLDLEMMEAHSFFQLPELIEREIAERQAELLPTEANAVVETSDVIARRRAMRQTEPLASENEPAEVVQVSRPKPRSRRTLAVRPFMAAEA